MTRSRAKAIHDKVNSFLYMCDLDSTMDGMLPHPNALCILSYESQDSQHGCIEDGHEDGQGSKTKKPEVAGVSAFTGLSTPRQPESPPALLQPRRARV